MGKCGRGGCISTVLDPAGFSFPLPNYKICLALLQSSQQLQVILHL